MWPVFADLKTHFVFKRIFGAEPNKHLLIELLNALLELEGEQRIADLTYLSAEQKIPVAELKLSIVDVKCRDHGGREYVVEMQILNVEAFEKRVVYNVSKAYVMQIHGALALSQVQYVFLELPKYAKGAAAETTVECWVHFFRVAEDLRVIPPELSAEPFRSALEQARTASFTPEEWDAYDRAKIAEQDARGAVSLAERVGEGRGFSRGRTQGLAEGHSRGLAEGLRRSITEICELLEIPLEPARRAEIEAMSVEQLEALLGTAQTRAAVELTRWRPPSLITLEERPSPERNQKNRKEAWHSSSTCTVQGTLQRPCARSDHRTALAIE